MMGRSPQCYIPSFVEILPPVLVKKNFEGVLPYMGMAAILTSIILIFFFISMYLKAKKQNLVKNGPEVFEKSLFYFSYINGLGPMSRNDLDLQYSHTVINSICCLHLPTFKSQASIVSEKSTFFTFSYRKA